MGMTDRQKHTLDEAALDDLFAQMQDTAPAPSNALLARIIGDGMDHLPDATPTARAPEPAPRASVWAQLFASLGGWRGAGGLTVAACLGLWIGIADPSLATLTGGTDAALTEAELSFDIFDDFAYLVDES